MGSGWICTSTPASGTATKVWVRGIGDGVRESYTPPKEAYHTRAGAASRRFPILRLALACAAMVALISWALFASSATAVVRALSLDVAVPSTRNEGSKLSERRKGGEGMTNNLWYRAADEGWSPALYEWLFHRTKRGLSLREDEEQVVYRLLDGSLGPTSRIVEYGPGTGHFTVPLARRCEAVVAVEPSAKMRERLRERLRREGIHNVDVRAGMIEDGTDPSGSFDGALAIGPLYHVRDLQDTLLTMRAGLKPGGWAVFSVPLLGLEGAWQLLGEFAARRRTFLRIPVEAALDTQRAGLKVRDDGLTGTTKTGLSVVLKAENPSHPATRNGTETT